MDQRYEAAGHRRSAWVWLDHRQPHDPEALATFAGTTGVREVFVSVPWAGPDGRVRETVAALRRAVPRVSALGGSAEWAERPQLAREWSVRAGTGDLFDGIHLDIEPWTLPTWPRAAPRLLAGLADAVRLVGEATGRPVEVDLAPHVAALHPVGFISVADAAHAVTLMSYRDTARAILSVSAQARSSLTTLGRAYRLAVDTLPSDDPGTSFAGQTRAAMEAVMVEVEQALRGERHFQGVAVHDLVGWRTLPATDAPR